MQFPRVIVYLDYESLEPTEECIKQFKDIANQTDTSIRKGMINAFKAKYGIYFQAFVTEAGRNLLITPLNVKGRYSRQPSSSEDISTARSSPPR